MPQFNLLAFVPFGILLGTALIAAMAAIWIRIAHGNGPGRARPKPDAQILYFPTPAPRRRVAGDAVPRAVYARAPLAG